MIYDIIIIIIIECHSLTNTFVYVVICSLSSNLIMENLILLIFLDILIYSNNLRCYGNTRKLKKRMRKPHRTIEVLLS